MLGSLTIDDVAKRAGVSMKTVSRVVNKESGVRQVTKDKVLSAIKVLGYVPNQAARGLAGSKSYLLGLLYDNPSAAYVLALQEGVLSKCEGEGYGLLIHPCVFQSETLVEDVLQRVQQSRIDGLLLTPPLSDCSALINALDSTGIKFVRVSPKKSHLSESVVSNEVDAVKELIHYLVSLGHREIGFIQGHIDHGSSYWRQCGFNEAMQEAGLSINPDFVQEGDFSFESGAKCARIMLEKPVRPTAIFASNDYMAAGVMKVAQQMSMSIPGDLSIAGFDDAPVASQLWPPLTTIKQPVKKIAFIAADLLISQLRGETQFSQTEGLGCELVIRGTTGISPG